MIYQITPRHFGLTTERLWLMAAGSLTCFALTIFVPSWMSAAYPWNWRDVFAAFFTWGFLVVWGYWQYNYSLEVNESSIRSGRRVVRQGHIRHFCEIDRVFGGRRLVISEHGSARVHLLGGVIEIPSGIPEYKQLKAKLSTWVL